MNHLIIEGYTDAAKKFSVESGLALSIDIKSMEARMHIKSAIQEGNISKAIELINDFDSDILDQNPYLHFHLLQQQFIEYLREDKITEALQFSQEELAQHGEQNMEVLKELEETMVLFILRQDEYNASSGLLDISRRADVANEMNAAILASHYQVQESRLLNFLKLLIWIQDQLDEFCIYPKLSNFNSGRFK